MKTKYNHVVSFRCPCWLVDKVDAQVANVYMPIEHGKKNRTDYILEAVKWCLAIDVNLQNNDFITINKGSPNES